MAKITLNEIAELAGVSRGTVDRVLNKRGRVSAVTAQRIIDIAQKLGYRKNTIASALASQSIFKVAVIIPSAENSSFWKLPEKGINESAKNYMDFGLEMTYFKFDHRKVDSFMKATNQAINLRPSAYLLAPLFTQVSMSLIQVARQNGTPVFTLNTQLNSADDVFYVGQNSFSTGVLAGSLFSRMNHDLQSILCLTLLSANEKAQHTDDKVNGLSTFFQSRSIKVDIRSVVIKEEGLQSYLVELKEFISNGKGGLFITNGRAHRLLPHLDLGDHGSWTVIGYDLISENIRCLNNGTIDVLLNQNPEQQGSVIVTQIYNHLILKTTSTSNQYLPCDIVVKENYEYYL